MNKPRGAKHWRLPPVFPVIALGYCICLPVVSLLWTVLIIQDGRLTMTFVGSFLFVWFSSRQLITVVYDIMPRHLSDWVISIMCLVTRTVYSNMCGMRLLWRHSNHSVTPAF